MQMPRLFGSVGLQEPGLRLLPEGLGVSELAHSGRGDGEGAAAAVGRVHADSDETVALERTQVPSQRRPVHAQLGRERLDASGTGPMQYAQERELGGPQPGRRQEAVTGLREMPRGPAHGEAGAWGAGKALVA